MEKKTVNMVAILLCAMLLICSINSIPVKAVESSYSYSSTATSGNVKLKVEWNEPKLGQPTTFHVSAIGGSGNYMFRMDAPSYSNPDERIYESVADPSRGEWIKYTEECSYHDFEFTMMATGTYNFRFYLMDKSGGVYYLRDSIYISVQDEKYSSVNSIVKSAVSQCDKETDGTDYEKALWLHDWLLEQLEYDNSLKWSSSESALTRGLGTCQAYESAYSKLLSVAGIENSETRDTYDGHTWNAVKLDGKWYQVDCTWDDTDDNWYEFDQRHLYFALTDELMAIAHNGHNKIYTASDYDTRSVSLKDNYFVSNGVVLKWVETYRDRIQSELNLKHTTFSIEADNSTYPPSISGIQNGIIAYAMNQIDWSNESTIVELNADGDATKFTFNVQYSTLNLPDDESEIDKLAKDNIDVIEDGIYVIKSAVNNRYVLDVSNASSADGANIQLSEENATNSQNWIMSHDEKGYVIITNMGNGKVLDVESGSANNGTNVQQYSSNLTKAQKWIAIKQADESVQLISALDINKCLDLNCAKAEIGSNIQIYESNGTNAQRWKLGDVLTIDDIANKYREVVADGIYVIKSAVNDKYVLDVGNASSIDGANIQLSEENDASAQNWVISHDENGYVIITNVGSSKVLDVESGNTNNGTNVQQYSSNLTKAQKWIAIKQLDGSVQLISALDINKCIDLNGANADNGSNIQICNSNGTNAQRWILEEVSTIDDIANKYREAVADGICVIKSAVNERYVLDVSNGSSFDGANVQLYERNDTDAQKWTISHDEKGYVIITNIGSGKVLDVESASTNNGTNVQQYSSNLTKAQKWIAIKQVDGSVQLISALDINKCIDLNCANADNCANIQIYESNESKAQKWIFDYIYQKSTKLN